MTDSRAGKLGFDFEWTVTFLDPDAELTGYSDDKLGYNNEIVRVWQ